MNLKNGEIIIRDTPVQAAAAAANLFAGRARECVSEKGFFTVAISGGFTPRPVHRMLSKEPHLREVPWNKTHIFWVDERWVPENDPQSNYGAAKEDILGRVDIPREQIYPMLDRGSPGEWALKYQRKIIDFFQVKEREHPIFDLIVLGIGTDGHTASLFPGQEALSDNDRIIIATRGGNPCVDRITMTFSLLNRAAHLVFLASGKGKATVVNNILRGRKLGLPASRIHPMNGSLAWILDKDAASLLPRLLM